ncbi:MAG: type II secretion system F family protein [Acidimicrobiia bacterium]
MRPVLRLLVGAAAVVAAVAMPASPAAATDGLEVRRVDTASFPEVRLSVQLTGEAPGLSDFHVRENGRLLPDGDVKVTPLRRTASPVGTVLVIDTSGSMQTGGAIDRAKSAARAFVEERQPNDWIAVVGFSSRAEVKSGFTQDGAALLAAIDGLRASGETGLWDGVVAGAALYRNRPDLQPNLLVLSDGADTVSGATQDQAASAVTGAHADLFAIAIESDEFDPAILSGFVVATDGTLSRSADPADLSRQFDAVRSAIENQYEIVYRSSGDPGALSVVVSAGDRQIEIQTRAGTVGVASGPVVVAAGEPGLLGGGLARVLAVLLAAAGIGLLTWVLIQIFSRRESQGIERLAHYDGTHHPGEAESSGTMVETGLVQRAVDMTSRMADRAGLLERVDALLERANLPLRSGEAMFFYGAGVVLVGGIVAVAAPSLVVAALALVAVAAAPVVVMQQKMKKRLKAFEAQLPETLNMLSGSLRAGYSFLQGVEAVASETVDPMAKELRRALAEARLGRPVEEALEDVATRMQSKDFEWAVLAIAIQREVGGNLAEVLNTVADTMIQRGRLKGEIKTLTAEGRISGIVMGLLPVGLAAYLFTVSPEYIGELFGSVVGWSMVVGSALMAAAGYAWIQKIIKIEV